MADEETAFRAAIAAEPDDTTARLAYADWLCDRPAEVRGRVEAAVAGLPTLMAYGADLPWDRRLTRAERAARHERERAYLFADTRGVSLCLAWLAGRQPIKTPSLSSYWLKHRVEDRLGEYVANGAFIAAAVFLGFPHRVTGVNVDFGISKRSLKHG